jgi:hypothetical protein
MQDFSGHDRAINPFALGAAYLEYCVKQGWLAKIGEGETAQYELTELGEKKLANVPFNFDLSKLTKTADKKKRHHRTRYDRCFGNCDSRNTLITL